ncbi:MAG: inositol monophosphatase family protein [Pseudomonadota bacterium]
MPSISDAELGALTQFAHELADASGPAILPYFRSDARVDNKDETGFDPVTEGDKAGERAIRELIAERFPNHGVLGEEYGETNQGAAFRWVLDPVDGTRAFIAGLPTWTTLIALEADGAPILGLIDQPFTAERWTGSALGTSFRRPGQADVGLRTKRTQTIEDAVVSTTDPRPEIYFSSEQAEAFDAIARAARLARFGLDAYAYAMVAQGGMDLVIETGLQVYDYSARPVRDDAAGGAN